MALTGFADLLATWEHGLACPAPARALVLHRAARPQTGPRDLLAMPVGTREADLYAWRRALFGDRMDVLAECSACGEVMEFELDAGALADPPDRSGRAGGPGQAGGSLLGVAEDGWEVEFRPPSVGDLAAVAGCADPAEARRLLVARCTVAAFRDGRPADPADLPPSVQRRLAEVAERADPDGDLTLRVACPECGATTPVQLDIAGYLWAELDCWARDLLFDVHVLAGAYGWTEPEILALSPLRRRYYLELCADA
jgi:hypothetical protein